MAERIPEEEQSNYETFRDCLSEPVLRTLAAPAQTAKKSKRVRKGRKSVGKKEETKKKVEPTPPAEEGKEEDTTATEDLADFIDVRAL
jgi:hypothetical protein